MIFVFEIDRALAQFLGSGWSGSGQADAAAKAGEKGGAYLPREYGSTRSPSMDEVLQGRRP